MFSKKASKISGIFTVDLTYVVSVKSTVKIFVAFIENMSFNIAHSYFQAPLISISIINI